MIDEARQKGDGRFSLEKGQKLYWSEHAQGGRKYWVDSLGEPVIFAEYVNQSPDGYPELNLLGLPVARVDTAKGMYSFSMGFFEGEHSLVGN